MSQLTHPKLTLAGQVRANWLIALAALLALVATAVVVLVLAVGDNPPESVVSESPQQALRADGGPEESAVAAALGSHANVAPPDESKIAAAISPRGDVSPSANRPDESAVANAIAGR